MRQTLLTIAGVFLCGFAFGEPKPAADLAAFRSEVFCNRQNEQLPFRLLYPANYNFSKKYPLILFLHGAGARGNDNISQLEDVPQSLKEAAASESHACFVLAPQCPKDDAWVWFPQFPRSLKTKAQSRASRLSLEIIDSLVKQLKIDRERIYVTGLSLGGEGTFDIITRRTNFFAAAVPVCGIADTNKVALMKATPLWIFHGEKDDINSVAYSRGAVKVLRGEGGNPRYTEYPGVRHDCWSKAYQEPGLLDWLFEQHLK